MIDPMPAIADLDWPRRTARLSLSPAVEGDLEALWQIRRQEPVGEWMSASSTEWDGFLEKAGKPGWLGETLTVRRDDAIIGDLMLKVEDAWAQDEVKEQAVGVQAELGWCFDPAVAGNGYATEAARELIRIAFADLGLRRVTALCFAANEASWRVMERVGMRREAHNVRESLHRSGAWLDGLAYALLADEWRDA
jgi:RimJ/RimL family protein N-acetyltransferase